MGAWCAVDTETTGLAHGSRPVEIGARRYEADGSFDDFVTLVDPAVPIPVEVQRIHGITDAMVRGAPDVASALGSFFDFADGAALVAHNARFDARILAHNAHAFGVRVPPLRIHDTVRLAKRTLPGLLRYNLVSVAQALSIEGAGHHRALADALVVARVVERFADHESLEGFPRMSAGFLGTLPSFVPRTRLASRLEAAVQEAAAHDAWLEIVYDGGSRGLAPRLVEPLGASLQGGVLRVWARYTDTHEERAFRSDRILSFRLVPKKIQEPPPGASS